MKRIGDKTKDGLVVLKLGNKTKVGFLVGDKKPQLHSLAAFGSKIPKRSN